MAKKVRKGQKIEFTLVDSNKIYNGTVKFIQGNIACTVFPHNIYLTLPSGKKEKADFDFWVEMENIM